MLKIADKFLKNIIWKYTLKKSTNKYIHYEQIPIYLSNKSEVPFVNFRLYFIKFPSLKSLKSLECNDDSSDIADEFNSAIECDIGNSIIKYFFWSFEV